MQLAFRLGLCGQWLYKPYLLGSDGTLQMFLSELLVYLYHVLHGKNKVFA